MKHLTDAQLVQLIYQDVESSESPSWERHVDECSECALKRRELLQTFDLLSHAETKRDWESEPYQNASDLIAELPFRSESPRRPDSNRWNIRILAASILMMVASGSFLAGSVYQSKQRADISSTPNTTSSKELQDRIAATLQQRLEEFESRQQVSAAINNQQIAASIESEFAQLFIGQRQLRNELQTLALNAEREIMFTKREVAKMQLTHLDQSHRP